MVLPYLHIRCQEYTPNTEGDHLNVTSNNLQHSLQQWVLSLYKHLFRIVILTTERRKDLKNNCLNDGGEKNLITGT